MFLPNGEEAAGADRMVRGFSKRHTFGVRCTDLNLIRGMLNHRVSAHISAGPHEAHRGFVRGRNLVANVVEMDIAARRFALRGTEHTLPILVLLDLDVAIILCRRISAERHRAQHWELIQATTARRACAGGGEEVERGRVGSTIVGWSARVASECSALFGGSGPWHRASKLRCAGHGMGGGCGRQLDRQTRFRQRCSLGKSSFDNPRPSPTR